ncbi:ribonuclease HIII [Salisediminibacterium halotolerans]|uniref:ribonuclease HIII n=1 Tax=Salisediminibacterium halotolerans TaxID=517425 RepID=UPI000EB1FC69|nr:ribonuclease HIII [Salisediminibacterium halotolerans]RLJ69439.1 ribonuclease HIII [Actinophytocola xinjiangensis]RPE84055.1 ribonuclease HIII [Salisediminibacterium halotolerans]TWG32514.1 ribonuclease HIII [Salisediminibacterium halotolerans]GEL09041.1 ribonuclease HIII [Salisediminibacterium halotolerans]
MSHAVVKATEQQMRTIKARYSRSLIEPPPQGALFQAKVDQCTITGYKSGKVLFQGKNAEEEAAKAKGTRQTEKKTKPADVGKHSYAPPKTIAEMNVIGSDETGTGDYFGPITVAACYIQTDEIKNIEALGVRDSKTLTDTRIKTIAPDIVNRCTYSLMTLHNKKYNQLQESGMNQGQMKAMLHQQAINNVHAKLQSEQTEAEAVLIDQFVKPETYFTYLRKSGGLQIPDIPLYFATKAEAMHPAVACASIIARYAFIQEIDQLSVHYGITLPKGAGPPVDKAANEFIRLYGTDTLKSVTKWHFNNTNKALN